MPRWFGVIFILTLLSAALSTLSSQFHVIGTSIGRDVMEQMLPNYKQTDRPTILVTRIGILVGLVVSIVLAYALADSAYIAIATALFFGLCAAAFLPAYVGGLFWKRMTRQGAIASMVGGFTVSAVWMLFFYGKTASKIGLCSFLFGTKEAPRATLLTAPNWDVVDPIMVGLPISILLAIVVSLYTKPMSEEHLKRCFE